MDKLVSICSWSLKKGNIGKTQMPIKAIQVRDAGKSKKTARFHQLIIRSVTYQVACH